MPHGPTDPLKCVYVELESVTFTGSALVFSSLVLQSFSHSKESVDKLQPAVKVKGQSHSTSVASCESKVSKTGAV